MRFSFDLCNNLPDKMFNKDLVFYNYSLTFPNWTERNLNHNYYI